MHAKALPCPASLVGLKLKYDAQHGKVLRFLSWFGATSELFLIRAPMLIDPILVEAFVDQERNNSLIGCIERMRNV